MIRQLASGKYRLYSKKKDPETGRRRNLAFEVTPEVFAVSYLSPSGFTLTVVLNFATMQLVGVASGGKDWYPLRGTFEVVG
jgi:hypothetical protein